ncbi:MAG: ARMT1-like domain-containing protein [Candidatus Alcyoniella australis]|nr:ARMT1-like domain-containing protein [Candidatus Alcyoniella australis]
MKTAEICIPCMLRNLRRIAERVTQDEAQREQIEFQVKEMLKTADTDRPPPYLAKGIQRIMREISGNADPYRREKEHFNALAMEHYPRMAKMVERSVDPFDTALRISLAGNIIDVGVGAEIHMLETLDEVLQCELSIDHTQRLRAAIQGEQRLLFLGDNAGETVMDRVFLERIASQIEISYAVRGAPVLNDATLEDAQFAGIDRFARVIDNGSDAPGVILEDCSAEFCREFDKAELIVAKGMGNFETLNDCRDKRIFFVFLVKCELVAEDIGVPVGGKVVVEKPAGEIL